MTYGLTYLSGAMNTPNSAAIFSGIEQSLDSFGVTVHNPADVAYGETDFASLPAEGFRNGLTKLAEAESVFLFGDWRNARGCIAEIIAGALIGCKFYVLDLNGLTEGRLKLTPLDITSDNLNKFAAELLTEQDERYKESISG